GVELRVGNLVVLDQIRLALEKDSNTVSPVAHDAVSRNVRPTRTLRDQNTGAGKPELLAAVVANDVVQDRTDQIGIGLRWIDRAVIEFDPRGAIVPGRVPEDEETSALAAEDPVRPIVIRFVGIDTRTKR